ncbi:MAG: carbohydrate kinase [Chloroflexi bacterium]|nr:carbohydrate kinase [Chloroflexota bacterium]
MDADFYFLSALIRVQFFDTMNISELENLLARFPALTLLVLGDYFLDYYLEIDSSLAEISLETGLEAHQVVQTRAHPGAAGTVTSNLRALGVNVIALGVIGDDGNGYELQRALRETGVDIAPLIVSRERVTPTYTKPLRDRIELNRLDIKNRVALAPKIENDLIARVCETLRVPRVNGIVIVDQVHEDVGGIVTTRVREEIARVAESKIVVVESRARCGEFRNVIVQANLGEAKRATGLESIEACGAELHRRTNRIAYITAGANGIFVFDDLGCAQIPAIPVSEPIDTVGAGDSVLAGFTAAICAGANVRDAAYIGNLVASVTIRQIGTTGTATPQQLLAAQRAIE